MNNALKKDLNLFLCVGREKGIGAVDFERSLKKCLVVFGAIFGVIFLCCFGYNSYQKGRIKTLNKQIEALQSDLAEIEEYRIEAETLQRDMDTFKQAVADFEASPRLTTNDIYNIAKAMPAGLILNSFSYSGNSIQLAVVGTTELMIADFANALRNSVVIDKKATTESDYTKHNFKDVQYTGVTKNEGTGSYTGAVSIVLNDVVVETPEVAEEAPETSSEAQ